MPTESLANLRDEPPPGAVVVLRSPSTGALIVADRATSGVWRTTRGGRGDWPDLIEGREVVAVHTPDVTT